MFGWQKKRTSTPVDTSSVPLFFKDTNAAFEFACEYLLTDLTSGAVLPALVMDSAAALGGGAAVRRRPDSVQIAMLRVSSKDGGYMVVATSASAAGPNLQPGDLVAWQAGEAVPELATQFSDSRSTWVGLILAKLKPEYRAGHGWAIDQPFKPQPISTNNQRAEIDVKAEVDRLFDASSVPTDQPKAVILMGGVAAGKTHVRVNNFSRGFVLIDAAEIFHHLSRDTREVLDFPDDLVEPLELIGSLVARRAISEKRNIVTEIIGADKDLTVKLISALKAAGYAVDVTALTCDLEESIRRNESRGDNISAYYAESFQIRWIIEACNA